MLFLLSKTFPYGRLSCGRIVQCWSQFSARQRESRSAEFVPNTLNRLALMRSTSLAERRIRYDLITTYKALSKEQSPIQHLVTTNRDKGLRGQRLKLLKDKFLTTPRQYFLLILEFVA
ncbi:hypothetical protein Zmor_021787 [Zophobas morio]|uniref:Uncharacterized protein n=1 Tax=Zophobas morio TaxID=2755281 RepID=A0AA38MBB2_9CUCU|nr:hypothetical protein Zmor_021787 [Zophobas morio]